MARPRGFTLTEMLVVLAILVLLASVMMPVFRAAKDSARQASCISNFRQVATASQIYLGDYDDRHVLVNHRPGHLGPPGVDRTWVQLVMPYARSFGVFKCPGDHGKKEVSEGVFDPELAMSDPDHRFYLLSQRANVAYNHQYLAPVVRTQGQWQAVPRADSAIADRSRAILFVDSAWAVDPTGHPYGGGRWIVAPPCRYEARGPLTVDTFAAEGEAWSPDSGWSGARGSLPYGGAWPWHNGRVNVVRTDSSALPMTIRMLTAGCDALPNWMGRIRNSDEYLWDLR